jgi:hypothetical protein
MSIATSLSALGDAIDPSLAYWSVLLTTGKRWSERQLLPTFRAGQRGLRKLDWTLDLVATGDILRISELTLHCPDRQQVTLEISEKGTAFQFKTRSLNLLGGAGSPLEYIVIGRVIDKLSGACECFAWDYCPKPGESHLVAYRSSILQFGAWRDSMTPMGALGIDVQGFRLA